MSGPEPSRGPWTEFAAGLRAQLPLLIGVAPFGMIYGALAREAGMSVPISQAMSAIIFAGSAQFLAAQLFKLSAPGFLVVASVFIINLRHGLYSAAIAPYLKNSRWPVKALAAYLLTDEAYAVAATRLRGAPEAGRADRRIWFLIGAGAALWLTWQIATALGVFLSALIPPAWQLDFTLPLTFIAIVVPTLRDRPGGLAAAVAAVAALALAGLPFKLGLVAAACAGIAAGALAERWRGAH